MVTAVLALARLIGVVAGAETVTGVAVPEWHTSLLSGMKKQQAEGLINTICMNHFP